MIRWRSFVELILARRIVDVIFVCKSGMSAELSIVP